MHGNTKLKFIGVRFNASNCGTPAADDRISGWWTGTHIKHSTTVLSRHSPTVLSSHSSTVLSSHGPTVLSSHSPSVLSSHSPTILSSHGPTVLSSHKSTILSHYNPTLMSTVSICNCIFAWPISWYSDHHSTECYSAPSSDSSTHNYHQKHEGQ
jgi:hypothetical protein